MSRVGPLSPRGVEKQFSLFGRLCSAVPAGTHRGLAARVFHYAVSQQQCWARKSLIICVTVASCGIHAPHLWGVSPGCSGSLKPSHVYVELLSGVLFTLCALAPVCGMDIVFPLVKATSRGHWSSCLTTCFCIRSSRRSARATL